MCDEDLRSLTKITDSISYCLSGISGCLEMLNKLCRSMEEGAAGHGDASAPDEANSWQAAAALAAFPGVELYQGLSKTVDDLLLRMPQREADIIRQRFQMDLSLRQVGRLHGLTGERINQIEDKALSKLRCGLYNDAMRRSMDAANLEKTATGLNAERAMMMQAAKNTCLEDLGLPARAYNSLRRNGFVTALDVLNHLLSGHKLSEMRNIGKGTENEVISILSSDYGLLLNECFGVPHVPIQAVYRPADFAT